MCTKHNTQHELTHRQTEAAPATMAEPCGLSVLRSQTERLRVLRDENASNANTLLTDLRAQLSSSIARERSLLGRVQTAERQASAAMAEMEELRSQLEKTRSEVEATTKRAAWNLRKQHEASVIAASAAAECVRTVGTIRPMRPCSPALSYRAPTPCAVGAQGVAF